jgi:hypothetical protein
MTMKAVICFLVPSVLGSALVVIGEPVSARVSCEPDVSYKSETAIKDLPAGDLIRVVGLASPTVVEQPTVFEMSIEEASDGPNEKMKATEESASAIPSEALWPDANGAILLNLQTGRNGPNNSIRRNPWIAGGPLGNTGNESIMFCGGVIIGPTERVALLNGRILKRGDKFGMFIVLDVSPLGVIFGLSRASFVVPRGRRVTVNLTNI